MRPADSTRTTLALGGVACVLVAGGFGLLLTGPEARPGTLAGASAPEVLAHWPVTMLRRQVPATIHGPRFVVGDGLAFRWLDQETVFARSRVGSGEMRRAVLALERAEPVPELVLWLGNNAMLLPQEAVHLGGDIAAIITTVAPERYVIVAPQPLWTSQLSVAAHETARRELTARFPDRVVDPFPVLQAALARGAPVYYDDFWLTAVGYAHVTNLVERALGYDRPLLGPTHGIAEYGRMRAPLPAGMTRSSPRRLL